MWVCGYGSPIWNPGFELAGQRRGTSRGWHRRSFVEQRRWRGTPERPGLMLALIRGGRRAGLLLRLPAGEVRSVVHRPVRREIAVRNDPGMARWIAARTADGPGREIVVWAGPSGRGIQPGLPLETLAWRRAHACGHVGSSAEHLRPTVRRPEDTTSPTATSGVCSGRWRPRSRAGRRRPAGMTGARTQEGGPVRKA
jgi:cation transport protein ChaC